MNFYLDSIDKKSNEVHLLFWNRDLKKEDTTLLNNIKIHEFKCQQDDDVSKLSKIGSFIKYRNYALKLLKSNKFDFIIVLHSLTGVVIADKLTRDFSNRYIFDYRDSTYEGFKPFKAIVGRLVKKSYVTFVSSDAFRRFLPIDLKNKIYTSHNILVDSLLHRDERELHGISSPKIRVAFWGFIRHEEINLTIIKKISKDKRFELHYYGREQQIAKNLKKYIKEHHISNVFFHGEYKPTDRYNFVRETDLIHNIYYDSNMMLAMGNKYYDSIIFRIPQLCMKGAYMAKRSTKAGVGFACDPNDSDFTEKIYQYYTHLDKSAFDIKCNYELDRVYNEYLKGISIIESALSNGESDG